MATTVLAVKPKKTAGANFVPTVNSVMTKTVTFDVTTGGSAGDILVARDFLPAGFEIRNVYYKVSASQGGTTTFAIGKYATGTTSGGGVYTTGSLVDAAFVAATTLTSTALYKLTMAPGTGGVNGIVANTCDLGLLLALGGTTAATITLTVELAAVDTVAGQTTFTI